MRLKIFPLLTLLLCSNCVSGDRGSGVIVKNINDECGRTPSDVTLGTSLPSVVIQRNKGNHKLPCVVTQPVITNFLLEKTFNFYIKVVALNLPRSEDGECYHSLRIDGLANRPHSDPGVELCGTLAQAAETAFVSIGHDIDVIWNASNTFDSALTKQGLNEGFFKVVITVFTEAEPVIGCPEETDPSRPDLATKYHLCSNNRCIDAKLRCNRFNNCGDLEASDELDCNFDGDGGFLYIIFGIVMGGLCITIILIYFLFCVRYDGDKDEDESGDDEDVDEDDDEQNNANDPSAEGRASAPVERREDRREDPVDKLKAPPSRSSAILDLETIDEENQESA